MNCILTSYIYVITIYYLIRIIYKIGGERGPVLCGWLYGLYTDTESEVSTNKVILM